VGSPLKCNAAALGFPDLPNTARNIRPSKCVSSSVSGRMWPYARRVIFTVAGLVLALACVGLAYRIYRLHQFAKAVQKPNGIDEAGFFRIGGIDQWITIRGQSRDNPVLLLLHGGPGNAFQSLELRPLLDWERFFVVVQWDQRSAGKTYGKSGPVGSSVTIDRMVLDGIEVADLARRKVGKQKVILLGLSWGSILGIKMARAKPELFHAYVGTGQIVDYRKGKAVAYSQLVADVRAKSDRRAIQELEAIGPPPYATAKARVYTKWANAYEPGMPSIWSTAATVLFDSPITPLDLSDLMKGIRSSEDHFRAAGEGVDLSSFTDFAIPVFFFQGTLDNVAPAAVLGPYVERIKAPQKRLVLIAGAGHNAMFTGSSEFLNLLVQNVRPLATNN
jgi:pimeloyl-ACP methyl ester carboxylesterase